jgi:lambda repressor-like predicted transcriptional regulator
MRNWPLIRLLAKRQITERDIVVEAAEALGVKPVSVYNVVEGHRQTKRTEEWIARRLDVPIGDIFPHRKHKHIVAQKKAKRI